MVDDLPSVLFIPHAFKDFESSLTDLAKAKFTSQI